MISRRIVINVITFLVLSAILIAALMINIFRIQPRYAVWAEFQDTGGAFTGQEVTYRGVTVGRIGELRLTQDGVAIELVIERTHDQIPADTRARIMFKSAVGEQFVDLLPQSTGPPFLDHGDEIPRDRTEVPVQQEDLLRLLAAVLDGVPPDVIGSLVETLGTGLGPHGDDLHLALRSLDPITEVLARRVDELNRINVNADRLGAAFSRTSAEFVAGTRSLATVAESLGRASGDIDRLLVSGSTAVPEIAALIANRKVEIDRTIANLAEVTRLSFDNIESVSDTLDWLPLFLQAIIRIYDPQENRLRFGLTDSMGNEPCSYGTPRREPSDRSGNAPHQPVTEFECQPAEEPPLPLPIFGSEVGAEEDPGYGGWIRLVADTLPVE